MEHRDPQTVTIADFFAFLVADDEAAAAREQFCDVVEVQLREVASWLGFDAWLGAGDLEDAGSVEGAPPDATRARSFIAVGLVAQIGGELVAGARLLFRAGNEYGAAALVRQLIECEYLLRAFRLNFAEAARWFDASSAERWDFRPAKLRKIGGFDHKEYSDHCESGGHPHRKGALLLELPRRIHDLGQVVSGATKGFDARRGLWLDFAFHCDRTWRALNDLLHAEYVPILQRTDEAERAAFDVRLPRFEGMTEAPADWRPTFDSGHVPALTSKLPWKSELADTEIETFLKQAFQANEEAGQKFVLEGAPSYNDFDQVIELAYAVPLLKELRAPHLHKNAVKEIIREFLERKTFALPAGLPLRFGGVMDPADARIALGNLARSEVIKAVRDALLPAINQAMSRARSPNRAQLSERRAAELRNYQALKKNVVPALTRSTFQQAAVENADERKVSVLLDRATDVAGWLYNHRHGVGFSIPYDWHGRTAQYFPDFIARAKLGEVFHNFVVEVKGRLDDRDKTKARAGVAYCELLTQHDPEPWHYLMLIENEPIGREDIEWWSKQSTTEIGDLLRHHETLSLVPDVDGGATVGAAFQVLTMRPTSDGGSGVAVYDLAVAAGAFSASQTPEPIGWVQLRTRRVHDDMMFVARVDGHSMEDGIPDGSHCLFRAFPAGTAPNAIALDGRRVVVELRDGTDGDLGGRYTLKRWRVAKRDEGGGAVEVELRADQRSYASIRLRADDGEIRVVAEFLEVLG